MSPEARAAVAVLDGSVDSRDLEAALPSGTTLRVVALGQGLERILAAVDEASADLILIGCEGLTEAAIGTIGGARARRPQAAVVVIQFGEPNGSMQRAFEAGADDLISLPQPPGALAFALQKAIARRRNPILPAGLGSLICIVGPKGGTGKTLTACNLAVALALAGKSAVIMDADLQFGDVGISLGLKPDRTIYDLAVSPGPLDEDKVERFLIEHSSGALALLAPIRPDQAGAIDVGFLRELFSLLRGAHDFVIVDTPPAFSPEVIVSIDCATDLCVVGMLDALSLKDTKIGLETLALMGHDVSTLRLVLNRSDTSVGISQDDVEKILGRRPDVFIPSDRAIPRAITEGLPIVLADDRSGPAKAFTGLADMYLAQQLSVSGANDRDRSRRKLFRKG